MRYDTKDAVLAELSMSPVGEAIRVHVLDWPRILETLEDAERTKEIAGCLRAILTADGKI